MKRIEKKYDFIIYPANFAGCITAIKKSSEGAEVLLLNNYGFPGGELTQSLCCHQFINHELMDGKTLEIYNQILEERQSIFLRYLNQVVINPETVKYILQKNLELNKIDLLFHIVPFKVYSKNSECFLHLSAKEGEIVAQSNQIIDCSENFSLMKLLGYQRNLKEANFNLFVSRLSTNGSPAELAESDKIIKYHSVKKFIQLFNLRYWVSLNIPIETDELFLENEAQKVLNEYEIYLLTKGLRVQLIAPQTYRLYQSENLTDLNKNIFHINSILDRNYTSKETFFKASAVEKALTSKVNQNEK